MLFFLGSEKPPGWRGPGHALFNNVDVMQPFTAGGPKSLLEEN